MADDDLSSPVIRIPERTHALDPADPLEVSAWRLTLGLPLMVPLPDVATDALVRGIDSPSLRQLAGIRDDDVWERDRLWADTVQQLGITVPQAPEARRLRIRATATDIVAGRIRPLWGAGSMVGLMNHERSGPDALNLIEGLFYEDDDVPDERPAIERRIRLAAEDLLREWTDVHRVDR